MKCVVSPCLAVSCKHNKNKSCVLEKVTVNERGTCVQFSPMDWKENLRWANGN